MNQKKQIFISIVAAFLVLILLYFIFIYNRNKGGNLSQGGNNNYQNVKTSETSSLITQSTSSNALTTVPGGTREVIQEKIATPDVNSSVPQNVARPTTVLPAEGNALRQFEIKAQEGKFIPSIIVVNEGDVVNLVLNAVDSDYNIYFPDFGNVILAKKGTNGRGQFTASPYGQYKFFCDQKTTPTCPPNMSGTFIINK